MIAPLDVEGFADTARGVLLVLPARDGGLHSTQT